MCVIAHDTLLSIKNDHMNRFLSLPYITSGFIAVLIGYSSAAAIVYQAALASGADTAKAASWMWAVGVGMGVCGIALSLRFKAPIIIAWSTPGAALLVTSLPGVSIGEAVGAFLFSSALLTICGITGWFEKIMKLVPVSIASAMLAGVLLQFAFNAFSSMESNFFLTGAMIFTYLIGKRITARYAIPLTLLVGIAVAAGQGLLKSTLPKFAITVPVWTTPELNWPVLLGVGFPLFVVTMASQNIPGIAVLRAHGYQTPASPLISWSGITGLITAPFGGFAFNLAAITAAICMGKEIDPDPSKRYGAAIWAGVFYISVGILGSTITDLFAMFPIELIMTIAGLALLGTISNAMSNALSEENDREAAFLTFVITASGVTLFSIGAPFWGLVVGLMINILNKKTIKLGLKDHGFGTIWEKSNHLRLLKRAWESFSDGTGC
ncbi:benzoate/H(+) symporter BenE family transporter [Sneathiella limimaris]|uniref:benzoate/H(+) symporter BenE family transporter n=1 Tax=Sneathiella limimaris TaxID=1964213 RepID=UPI00146A0B05|nr:benzoate/H(+) symporter BenE family transporter [Sneathiella limimaris]